MNHTSSTFNYKINNNKYLKQKIKRYNNLLRIL